MTIQEIGWFPPHDYLQRIGSNVELATNDREFEAQKESLQEAQRYIETIKGFEA